MTPELRAIADRFIYEQATLKHMTALAPEDAMRRPVPGSAWNVAQLLGHLALSMNSYAGAVRGWLGGETDFSGFDAEAMSEETAARFANASRLDVTRAFGAGLVELFAVLGAVPDERMDAPFGTGTGLDTLRGFGEHFVRHAIPLVDALPEARMDPLVLNWVLDAEFDDEPSHDWQRRLLAEAQEYIASHPEEDEDEE